MFERFRSLFRARAHRRDSDPITSLPERSHFHRRAIPITSPALPLLRSWSIRSAIWPERSPPASSPMCHSVESGARVRHNSRARATTWRITPRLLLPLKGYGAVEIGVHRFHHSSPPGDGVGDAKFVTLWQNKCWCMEGDARDQLQPQPRIISEVSADPVGRDQTSV